MGVDGWHIFFTTCMAPIQIPSLEVLQNPTQKVIVPRSSKKEETVKLIEDDLKAAAEVLPAKYSKSDENFGRFTKGLAYTVLMKLYMHEKRMGARLWNVAEKS